MVEQIVIPRARDFPLTVTPRNEREQSLLPQIKAAAELHFLALDGSRPLINEMTVDLIREDCHKQASEVLAAHNAVTAAVENLVFTLLDTLGIP